MYGRVTVVRAAVHDKDVLPCSLAARVFIQRYICLHSSRLLCLLTVCGRGVHSGSLAMVATGFSSVSMSGMVVGSDEGMYPGEAGCSGRRRRDHSASDAKAVRHRQAASSVTNSTVRMVAEIV